MNYRLIVQNDLQTDVAEHKKMLADNEDARDSLQAKIRNLCDAHEQLK
jgi:hypothetical protein